MVEGFNIVTEGSNARLCPPVKSEKLLTVPVKEFVAVLVRFNLVQNGLAY